MPMDDGISTQPPLADAPSWIDVSLIEDALRRLEKDDTIAVESLTITSATAPGDNYGSILYRVKASLTDGAGQRSLVVKALPTEGVFASTLSESGIFSTEISMFSKYIPAMQDLLDRVAPGRFPPFAAQCPLYDKATEQFLILEDLKDQGFRLAQRQHGLGLRHTLLALRALARYHAASAVILKENPNIVSDLPNAQRKNAKTIWEPLITSSTQAAIKVVRKWNGFEEYPDKLERFNKKIMAKLIDLNDPRPGSFNVISHGDFWINNMMFKYDDNGYPIDVRMVDFQISHVTSLAIDVVYLLNTSVNEEVFKNHERLLLREYHSALSEALDLLGVRGPSFSELLDEINQSSDCAVYCVVVGWPMVRSEKELDLESSVKGETEKMSYLYEREVTKRWLQYILPEYNNRGWLEY